MLLALIQLGSQNGEDMLILTSVGLSVLLGLIPIMQNGEEGISTALGELPMYLSQN